MGKGISFLFVSILISVTGVGRVAVNSLSTYSYSQQWVLEDGKILIIRNDSHYEMANGNVAMVRTHSDGTLDRTFGNNGKVKVNQSLYEFHQWDFPRLVVDDSGSIYIYGYSNVEDPKQRKWIIRKFLVNGAVDKDFALQGTLKFPASPELDSVWVGVSPRGAIYWIASGGDKGSTIYSKRWDARGQVDIGYASAGYGEVTLPHMTEIVLKQLNFRENGEAILGVECYRFGTFRKRRSISILNFTENGMIEGRAVNFLDTPDVTRPVLRDIAVSKEAVHIIGNFTGDGWDKTPCFVARFGKNLQIDRQFGTQGIQALSLFSSNVCHSIVVNDLEKIFVAYSSQVRGMRDPNFGVVSLEKNGSPRSDFGNDGYLHLVNRLAHSGNLSVRSNHDLFLNLSQSTNQDNFIHPMLYGVNIDGKPLYSFGPLGIGGLF